MSSSDAMTESQATIGNRLLGHLGTADLKLLQPHLKKMQSAENHILYRPGDNVGTVYFPLGRTFVSIVVDLEEGRSVETALIGSEGAVGGIVSAGSLPAYSRIMVPFEGEFLTLPVQLLNDAKDRSPALNDLFSRYADCLLAQILQSTACNAVHSIEQRVCKWIMAAIDRTGGDVVPMTQERLAAMLGVGRSYVTRLIGDLKRQGLLTVSRGQIRVASIEGIEAVSCKCNRHVKQHYDRVMQGMRTG